MIKEKLKTLLLDKNKRNFFIYGVGQAFNLLSPLIVTPLVVSVCQESGFGKVGLGFALALFLILIVDYAFDIKGTKYASENRDDPNKLQELLSTTLATKFFLFAVACCIAFVLVLFVPFFHNEKILILLSLTIVLAQVFNPIWFLQGIEKFPLISAINIGSKVLYVSLVVFFIRHFEPIIHREKSLRFYALSEQISPRFAAFDMTV